jgi:hypothetical protein
LANGGHERTVDVGWQSSGQWCRKAGKVAAVQNESRWPVGPTPDRDVVEEAAEVSDGAGVVADRDGAPGASDPSPAGAASVVAEEILQMAPGKLTQGADLGMMLAEPHPEQGQARGAGLNRLGTQGRRDDAQVANERITDDRLRNDSHPLLEAGVSSVAVLGRLVDHTELVADGVQAVQQPALGCPASGQDGHRCSVSARTTARSPKVISSRLVCRVMQTVDSAVVETR